MSPDRRKGKEAEVSGGVPPTTTPLLTFCGFYGWPLRGGGGGNPEVAQQPPRRQVTATLLSYVRLREDSGRHHNGADDASLHPGIMGIHNPDQRAATTVGGWIRAQSL